MKHLKMLGLLVMASASLMAFASSASATAVLTSPAGTEYTGTILASASTAGGTAESLTLKASAFTATCGEGTVHAHVTTNNTTHAKGPLTSLTFGDCDSKVVVLAPLGELTIDDNGEVWAIESEVTVEKFGFSCIYGGAAGAGTTLGTLTTGTTASLTVGAKLPRKAGSSPFCAAEGAWSGKYTITVPDTLLIT